MDNFLGEPTAFVKLKSYIGEITPEKVLLLSDEELKQCYFSRQKTKYAKCLAQAFVEESITLQLSLIHI